MGCCMSQMPPPIEPKRITLASVSVLSATQISKAADPKRYTIKPEPKLSNTNSNNESNTKSKPSEEDSSYIPYTPDANTCQIPSFHKTEFQLSIERKKTELLYQKQKLKELSSRTLDAQVLAQSTNYKRLYDIWIEYAYKSEKQDGILVMDFRGLTLSLKVFGMIIDTDRDFQKHIFKKFDENNEKEITYADFSATIASFVGSNTHDDSLQTLFEIFDIENKGYLEIEDMARILLAQNQITLVVTGQNINLNQKQTIKYTKKQCLKQARRMVAMYDSQEFNDNKISFNEFKVMMNSRTENDMIIQHMQTPSISIQNNEQNPIPIFIPNDE